MSKRKKKNEKPAPKDALEFYGGSGASFGGSVVTDIYLKKIKHRRNGVQKMAGTPKVYSSRQGRVQEDGTILWD